MGTIISAECECGFEPGEIFAGGGMFDFAGVCDVPALCENCREFVVVNYLGRSPKCPKCRKKVIAYNDPILQTKRDKTGSGSDVFHWFIEKSNVSFVLPDDYYLCPKCGKKRMRFFDVGCWD